MNRHRGWAALALGIGLVTGLATGLVTGRAALGQEAEFDGLVAGPGRDRSWRTPSSSWSVGCVKGRG